MSHGLNVPQREAVHYLDGPLLVLAGAGSGKTRVITQKIAWMIEGCGYPPNKITAITFTNKAAKEMKERADALLQNGSAEGLSVSTFHALGARFLRQEAKHLGLKPGFSIFDASDTAGLFQELLKTADKAHLRRVHSRISLWKNALLGPEQAASAAADEFERAAAATYVDYEKTLRAYQAVDFDDLIGLPLKLLRDNAEVAARWQSRFGLSSRMVGDPGETIMRSVRVSAFPFAVLHAGSPMMLGRYNDPPAKEFRAPTCRSPIREPRAQTSPEAFFSGPPDGTGSIARGADASSSDYVR